MNKGLKNLGIVVSIRGIKFPSLTLTKLDYTSKDDFKEGQLNISYTTIPAGKLDTVKNCKLNWKVVNEEEANVISLEDFINNPKDFPNCDLPELTEVDLDKLTYLLMLKKI